MECVEVTLVACWVPAYDLVGGFGGSQKPGCSVGLYRSERDGANLAVDGTDESTVAYNVNPTLWQSDSAYWKAILIPFASNVSNAIQVLNTAPFGF
jgi:hypothetical protein